jgi:sterol desaturase/sphingolipid hydroxylase (fatty acid hydroxylase superfamily)
MGVGSLLTPMISKKLLDPVTPTKGRHGKALLGLAAGAAVAASVGDVLRARHTDRPWPAAGRLPDGGPGWFDEPLDDGDSAWAHLTGAAAATAVMSSAVALATTWATQTSANRLFARHDRDLGASPAVRVAALLGWDFLYYWNHRWAHESRWMWAMHVVHHSSERYNLSTALRQPVGEAVTLTVPYGLLALLGVRPRLIEEARALNLIYQFWIHTEVIRSIGPLERILNTPAHHRVHHGSDREYLDRNHGSILIVWDRLFGTFEPERRAPTYGLTKDIKTFNPLRIATHEWAAIISDIRGARTWRDRVSYLVRGPGWAHVARA